jgi:hypothetical protein
MITGDQLLEVFSDYNQKIWPMQIVAYLLGFSTVILAVRKTAHSSRAIPAILAFFWFWVALLFWLPSLLQGFLPALIFTLIFLIQGLLFLVYTRKPKLSFAMHKDIYNLAGLTFILYALVGYPIVGTIIGHGYPRMPPFGLTPCPLVTFTFGMLLLAEHRVPKALLIIPFFYALSGFLWVSIGILEDIGMIASGLLGVGLIWVRDSKSSSSGKENEGLPAQSGTGWSLNLRDEKERLTQDRNI